MGLFSSRRALAQYASGVPPLATGSIADYLVRNGSLSSFLTSLQAAAMALRNSQARQQLSAPPPRRAAAPAPARAMLMQLAGYRPASFRHPAPAARLNLLQPGAKQYRFLLFLSQALSGFGVQPPQVPRHLLLMSTSLAHSAGGLRTVIKTTKTTDSYGRTTLVTRKTLRGLPTGGYAVVQTETTTYDHIDEEEDENYVLDGFDGGHVPELLDTAYHDPELQETDPVSDLGPEAAPEDSHEVQNVVTVALVETAGSASAAGSAGAPQLGTPFESPQEEAARYTPAHRHSNPRKLILKRGHARSPTSESSVGSDTYADASDGLELALDKPQSPTALPAADTTLTLPLSPERRRLEPPRGGSGHAYSAWAPPPAVASPGPASSPRRALFVPSTVGGEDESPRVRPPVAPPKPLDIPRISDEDMWAAALKAAQQKVYGEKQEATAAMVAGTRTAEAVPAVAAAYVGTSHTGFRLHLLRGRPAVEPAGPTKTGHSEAGHSEPEALGSSSPDTAVEALLPSKLAAIEEAEEEAVVEPAGPQEKRRGRFRLFWGKVFAKP